MKIDKCFIYILTSPSGKKYVGQTVNINKRFENYRNLRRLTQIKLSSAIIKYGWNSFQKEILDFYNLSQEELDNIEIEYIKKFDSYKNGYNCTIGGHGKRIHYTEEERKLAKLYRETKYRKNNVEKIRKRNSVYGHSTLGKETQHRYYETYYIENKETITKRNKEYVENNKEKHLARRRKYYQKNKEKENKRCRDLYWRKKLNITNDIKQ